MTPSRTVRMPPALCKAGPPLESAPATGADPRGAPGVTAPPAVPTGADPAAAGAPEAADEPAPGEDKPSSCWTSVVRPCTVEPHPADRATPSAAAAEPTRRR